MVTVAVLAVAEGRLWKQWAQVVADISFVVPHLGQRHFGTVLVVVVRVVCFVVVLLPSSFSLISISESVRTITGEINSEVTNAIMPKLIAANSTPALKIRNAIPALSAKSRRKKATVTVSIIPTAEIAAKIIGSTR